MKKEIFAAAVIVSIALQVVSLIAAAKAGSELLQALESVSTRLSHVESTNPRPATILGHGVSFSVSCDTTAAGVPIVDSPADGSNWSSLYCENNSTTSVFWGFGQLNGTAFDTAKAPCISTSSASCLSNGFSVDVKRGAFLCKTSAGSATLLCNAGGP